MEKTMSRRIPPLVAIIATNAYGVLMFILRLFSPSVQLALGLLAGVCLTLAMLYIWQTTLPKSGKQ